MPAIAACVDSIWLYDGPVGPPAPERVLPTGSMQLLVNLADDVLATHGRGGVAVGGAALQAAHGGPVLVDTAQQRRIVGVSFLPGGAHPFFDVPPGALDAQLVGLDELWGRCGATLRDRLASAADPLGELRRVLAERYAAPADGAADRGVARAVAALERGTGVAEVTDRLGVSRRRFGAAFTERVGLAPKRFARIRRFQRVLAEVSRGRVDWPAVAAAHGYCDQSHLIRDFHDFAATTPTGYRPRSAAERNHVPVSPITAAEQGAIMGP